MAGRPTGTRCTVLHAKSDPTAILLVSSDARQPDFSHIRKHAHPGACSDNPPGGRGAFNKLRLEVVSFDALSKENGVLGCHDTTETLDNAR
jgi:hypothetical protein